MIFEVIITILLLIIIYIIFMIYIELTGKKPPDFKKRVIDKISPPKGVIISGEDPTLEIIKQFTHDKD